MINFEGMAPRKKIQLLVVLIPLSFMAFWSFGVLLRSLGSGESWRVVFSTVGFAIFAAMSIVVIKRLTKD